MGKSKRNKQVAQTQAQEQTKPKQTTGKKKSLAAPLAIGGIALVVVIAIVAGSRVNTVSFVDGQASRIIATVDECASTELAIAIAPGENPESAAEAIFEALSKATGVGEVTVYEQNPRVQIEYCQSYTSEPALREALAPTGYLAE